jgi:hypothetical protein
MNKARKTAAALVALGCALAGKSAAQNLGMVADYGAKSVTVFDADSVTVLGTISLPVSGGATIGDCSIAPDQTVGFVTDFLRQVWVIDLTVSPPALASGPNPIPIANPGEDTVLSPDGKFLLVCDGSSPEPISIIDIATRTQVHTFHLGTDCNSIDVCEDGSVLVTSDIAHAVRRLTLGATGNLVDTGELLFLGSFNGGANNVYCAPGGRTGIVVMRSPQEIRSFTIPGLHEVDIQPLSGTAYTGISGVFSPDGERFHARGNGGFIDTFLYDPVTGALGAAPVLTLPVANTGTFYGIDQLALSLDGSRLYVPDDDVLRVYAAATGVELDTLTSPAFLDLTGVCLSPTLPVIEVAMEIKPESINPRSRGVIKVVILSDSSFDATEIDPATVRFGAGGAPVERFSFEDVDSDGDLDLVLQIRTEQTGIRCSDRSVSLEGETFGGRRFAGEEPIRTVGCPR